MTTELPRSPGSGPDTTGPLPRGGEVTQQVPVVVPRIVGDYEFEERVGEGGMGVVWRATDRRHPDRVVAVKVLRPHIAHDEHARERLRREVHTLARVHHPRVASVIDADVDGPAPYIVTEFVPGPPLDEVVDRDGPLRGEALLRLGRGLAEALHAIHEVGIVHRDLKPGNVLMVRRGDVLDPVVIDFGIAQVADDSRLTSTGLVMGTPGYLSPEVVEGGAVSEATDWWGWAATLGYAAGGHPPFGRGPVSVVLDRVCRGRVHLDGVDPRLRPLLEAALDPDPRRRPGEREVLDGLERYARNEDVTGALTMLHRAPDATRVAPEVPVGRTRLAQTRGPQTDLGNPAGRSGGQPRWREPAPMPRSWEHGEPGRSPRPGDLPAPGSDPRPAGRSFPSPNGRPAPRPTGSPYPSPAPVQGRGGSAYPEPGATAYPEPGGAPYLQPGATAYPQPVSPDGAGQVDPRIGKRARSGTLVALLAVFVAITSLAPLLGWGLYAVWGLLTRTVDRTLTGLVLRRHEAGRRSSDLPMAVLASPWHLVTAALSTVLALILPLAVAVVVALVFSGLVTTSELLAGVGPDHPLAVALGSLIGGWLGWWGLASTSLRRGSRTVVRGVVPAGAPAAVVVTLALVGAALGVWVFNDGGDHVSWWPLAPGTNPLDLLPFTLP